LSVHLYRVERLKRGEDVPGGFAPPLDFEQILRGAGWTKRDMDHAKLLASLPEEAIPAIVKASVDASVREALERRVTLALFRLDIDHIILVIKIAHLTQELLKLPTATF
jgi:hypothetical protein